MRVRGASHRGWSSGSGSGSTTSSPAPAIVPLCSASSRSSVTVDSPRPMLTNRAVGFIAAKTSRSNRPRVSSVSGAALMSQSTAPTWSVRSTESWMKEKSSSPARARVPAPSTRTPRPRSSRAIRRPMPPTPTTRARVPATVSVSRRCHTCARCRSRLRTESFANARTTPSTYSAIAWSKMPWAFVTVTSRARRSPGNRSVSIPALAACTQRRRSAAGSASCSAVEKKSHSRSASVPGSASARVSAWAQRTSASRVSRTAGRPRRSEVRIVRTVMLPSSHPRRTLRPRRPPPPGPSARPACSTWPAAWAR